LTTRFPVNDYYTRLRQVSENEAVPIPAADESFVALSRRDFVVHRYNLSRTEFELLRAIQQGLPLGRAIERAAQASSANVDELASNLKVWFRNWTAEGFFRTIRVVGPCVAPISNARAPEETTMKNFSLQHIAIALLACSLPLTLNAVIPPKVGDKAPDFALKTLDEQVVHLSDLTAKSNVVLIVLRGWPGYQCPLCTRQVRDYIDSSSGFEKLKARVVMVYPGPADELQAHAKEFLENKQWPKDFIYLTDPDYTMVNAYGLRWNAPRETAYPATFVLDRRGNILSAKISHSHGDRTKAADILDELKRLPSG